MPPIPRPTVNYWSETAVRNSGSPTEVVGSGMNGATRIIRVPWSQRFQAARGIIGYSKLEKNGIDVVGLRRLTPLPHPDSVTPDQAEVNGPGNMFAVSIRNIVGYQPIGRVVSPLDSVMKPNATRTVYAFADITVDYANPLYDVRTDTEMGEGSPGGWPQKEAERFLIISEPTPAAQYITLPGGMLKYAGIPGFATGIPISFNVGKVFPTLQFKLIWKRLPSDLYTIGGFPSEWSKRIWGWTDPYSNEEIKPMIGCVNKYTWYGYRPGSLLLEMVRPIPVPHPFLGIYEWDMEFTINLDHHRWNYKYFYEPGSAAKRGFYQVTADGNTYEDGSLPDEMSIYNEVDFNQLFWVGSDPLPPPP